MPNKESSEFIQLEGVEQNNLKGFDIRIPKNQLVVMTGMSGSGKSSLAFDTLFAEGQRRYVETFTPYARQFFDRMDKPKVEKIIGIPPSIAIEQRNSVKTTRSTVGTMTEITEFLKSLWPHVSQLICPSCGIPIEDDHPGKIWESVIDKLQGKDVLITFEVKTAQGSFGADEIRLSLKRQGFSRILNRKSVIRIDEAADEAFQGDCITVIQDRVHIEEKSRSRFLESVNQAYHFGKKQLSLSIYKKSTSTDSPKISTFGSFSRNQRCGECDFENLPARPALFNFNHPSGACEECNGFGRIIHIDFRLALPDTNLSIKEGLIKPWRSGTGAGSQRDLIKFCKRAGIDIHVPFKDLTETERKVIVEGEPGYGEKGRQNKWPHKWYGVSGYFRWLESKSYKMHHRVQLAKYRVYAPCPSCQGKRLKSDALNYLVEKGNQRLDISDFLSLQVNEAVTYSLDWLENASSDISNPIRIAAEEIHRRLIFLKMVGLGYLTLNRATRTLSGGETERVSLASCLGTRLVNTLFVLDEPSVGLHPRDTEKLVRILKNLRDAGNTVVVVEHEALVMKAADQVVDLGPRSGHRGGEVIFQGSYNNLLKSRESLTGLYLSNQKSFPQRRNQSGKSKLQFLKLIDASKNNINGLSLDIPLGKLVAVTGVSGSGKTSLIKGCLLPALAETNQFPELLSIIKPDSDVESVPDMDSFDVSGSKKQWGHIEGWEDFEDVLFVDQSSLGRTPRSNPAVYCKAFEPIRKLFAASALAKKKKLTASAFSFNSKVGQCEKCSGAGYEKIEMQFLSDVFVECHECQGKRYRKHILEITITNGDQTWNISEFLAATIDESIEFLEKLPVSSQRDKAIDCLRPLSEIGLGYLALGQPINTLSGGENQRLKLIRKLNELKTSRKGKKKKDLKTLFLFDEPTTGLHFEDIRLLIELFQRMANEGHSVIFIEHNLEMIQSADWIIDIGPEAGAQGGSIIFQGTPDKLTKCKNSHTGKALSEHFIQSN